MGPKILSQLWSLPRGWVISGWARVRWQVWGSPQAAPSSILAPSHPSGSEFTQAARGRGGRSGILRPRGELTAGLAPRVRPRGLSPCWARGYTSGGLLKHCLTSWNIGPQGSSYQTEKKLRSR